MHPTSQCTRRGRYWEVSSASRALTSRVLARPSTCCTAGAFTMMLSFPDGTEQGAVEWLLVCLCWM